MPLVSPAFLLPGLCLETLEVAITGTCWNWPNVRMRAFPFSSVKSGDPDPKHVPIKSYRGNVSVHGPRACYDESKRVGETLCYIFHTQEVPRRILSARLTYLAPACGDRLRVLPNFASRIKGGLPLNIYGAAPNPYLLLYYRCHGWISLSYPKGVPGEA